MKIEFELAKERRKTEVVNILIEGFVKNLKSMGIQVVSYPKLPIKIRGEDGG